MTKYKINNKWLVHHLNQISNQVQVLQPTNVARDHPLDFIIGDIQEVCKEDQNWHHFVNISHLCHPLNLRK
jgi:hypothetical protein